MRTSEEYKLALAKVLEKADQLRLMHQAFANDPSQSDTMRSYHGAKENAFLEFKEWLEQQIDAT